MLNVKTTLSTLCCIIAAKLRLITSQSLNHQIQEFAGALITIDSVGLSLMDFGFFFVK